MASFKPKQFGEGQEREKIKIIVSLRSFLTRYRKFQKNKKKYKKNSIMASFQAKIVCKRQRKRENKNYSFVSFRSYLTHNLKLQKNCKKIQKIKKCQYGFI